MFKRPKLRSDALVKAFAEKHGPDSTFGRMAKCDAEVEEECASWLRSPRAVTAKVLVIGIPILLIAIGFFVPQNVKCMLIGLLLLSFIACACCLSARNRHESGLRISKYKEAGLVTDESLREASCF